MFRGLVRIYGYLQQFAFSYIVSGVDFVNTNLNAVFSTFPPLKKLKMRHLHVVFN